MDYGKREAGGPIWILYSHNPLISDLGYFVTRDFFKSFLGCKDLFICKDLWFWLQEILVMVKIWSLREPFCPETHYYRCVWGCPSRWNKLWSKYECPRVPELFSINWKILKLLILAWGSNFTNFVEQFNRLPYSSTIHLFILTGSQSFFYKTFRFVI